MSRSNAWTTGQYPVLVTREKRRDICTASVTSISHGEPYFTSRLRGFDWPPMWSGLAGTMRRLLKTVALDLRGPKPSRGRRVALKKRSADQLPMQGLPRIASRRFISAPFRGKPSIVEEGAGF